MRDLNLTQGSPEWLAARAKYKTASEASAMMGVSTYMSRSELLRQKATGIVADPDAATQARFDAGHVAESLCRPLAEEVIGEPLYPIVAADDSDTYLASSDGATMLLDTGWEHKLLNAKLVEAVKAAIVPESHKWQLVHQCLVFGFKRILFSVSDGSPENHHHCWFVPSDEDKARLIAGWEQFDRDLAAYVPQQAEVKPAGQAPDALPALFVEVSGKVIASNLDAFKARALDVFAGIKTKLETDEDFADAEKTAKWCKEVEDKLEAAKANALGQTASIDDLFRTIDAIKEEARQKRLTLDKLVKAEKENRKLEIIQKTNAELVSHCNQLSIRCDAPVRIAVAFAEVVKGLKTLDSMRDKLSVALANAKVEANEIADRIERNRKAMGEHANLFPDFAQVCAKADDDFSALLAMRVAQRKEAEEKRLEAERERIRAEEQAKAQREAAEAQRKQQEEARIAHAEAEAARAIQQAAAVKEAAPVQATAPVKVAATEPANDSGPTMKLGEISALLGFAVTADFLASLGVHAAGQERAAKLYPASKFPTICRLISDHVLAQAFKKAA